MSIRDDFFAAQAKASLWDVAVSIKRGNPLPLDANAVYNALGTATVNGETTTYTAGSLLEYAKTNPVAYPGQICAVVEESKTTIYYLDQNLEVQPVGIIPTGDNKTIEVTETGAISLLGAAGAANGTLPMIDSETGKLVWKTLEDIGAGDGNDNTTYEFDFANQKITITPKFNGQPVMEGEGEEAKQVKYELDLSDFITSGELAEAIKDFVTTDTTYSVAEGEKVLKLEGTEFSTVISLNYVEAVAANEETGVEAQPAKIQLLGKGDVVIDEIDATPFIRDGMLNDVAYDAETKDITFYWNTSAGIAADTINIADLIDTYTAGNGLELSDNQFAIKIDTESESFLTVGATGLKVSGIAAAIAAAEGRAATDAESKANAAKDAAIADAATKYAPKTTVYTKNEIDDLLEGIQGGASESAASVNTKLEAYKKVVNAEVWGDEAGAGDENGNSRIDLLENAVDALEAVGSQANVLELVTGAADNRLVISAISNKTITIDDSNLRTDIANAKKAGDDAASAANTNAQAIAGHDQRIGNLETTVGGHTESIAALLGADTTLGNKILALETTVNNETSGVAANYAAATKNASDIAALVAQDKTHTEEIAGLKTLTSGHTTDISNINAALGNIYVKNDVYNKTEIDGKVEVINEALGKKLEASALEPYAKTADVAATYATIVALENEAKTARAAEKANADALAIFIGSVEGDNAKSVRAIAKEEVALVVGSAPEALNTLEEVADWIANDKTGAAAMAGDIAALKGLVDTGDKTVTKYVEDAIAAIPAYDLPVATLASLGGVKSSEGENKVKVAEDGTMEVNAINVNKLVQTEGEELVLNGGQA